MCFAKRVVLSLRVPLSLYRAGLSLSIHAVGVFVLGLYVLTCITLHNMNCFFHCLSRVVMEVLHNIHIAHLSLVI